MKKVEEYTEEELVYLQNKLLEQYAHFKHRHQIGRASCRERV